MKLFVLTFCVCALLQTSTAAYGQANLTLGPINKTIDLSFTSISATVTNRGDANSTRFRIRVWASVDRVIDASDLVETSAVLEPLPPFVPGQTGRQSERQSINFRFPLPPELDQSPLPRLTGDTFTPSEWIGREMFARACILDESGATELVCTSLVSDGNAVLVMPPRFGIVGGQEIKFVGPETTSNGISSEFIELTWRIPPLDNGTLLIDEYRFSQLDFNGARSQITVPINELEVFTNSSGVQMYRLRLLNREPGKRYGYSAARQVCLNGLCSFPSTTGNEVNNHVGNTFANIIASTDLDGKVALNWESFAAIVGGYDVTRCEVDTPSNCVKLASRIQGTAFEDTSPERGKRYIYHVEVCDRESPSNFRQCSTGPGPLFRVGVSNPGSSSLVDEFEDDDTPGQATLVSRDVSQLHSFDSPLDDDWLKVSLVKAGRLVIETASFGGESVDTVLTLYDAQQALIALNDDKDPANSPGSFSKIESESLSAGDYFVKATHYKLPGGEFPAPTANNYLLSVTFVGARVDITPIIQLLLSDEQ